MINIRKFLEKENSIKIWYKLTFKYDTFDTPIVTVSKVAKNKQTWNHESKKQTK